MKLLNLIEGVSLKDKNKKPSEMEVLDIKIDSRNVKKGDVFIALTGENFDGNDYIKSAFNNGAACVITDKDITGQNIIQVENARSAYAIMSKNYFGRACDFLKVIAITGTNGKTTTSNLCGDILRSAGFKVGVIGTLGAKVDGEFMDTGFTTPDPYILHSLFKDMKDKGVEYVIMEASAHALALNKLDGIEFEIGVLTNITEDHLDFFGDMDRYAEAKLKLFERGRTKLGIYCDDKAYIERLKEKSDIDLLSYGFNDNCDYYCKILKKNFSLSRFVCKDYKNKAFTIEMPLQGQFNIENAMAAIAVCRSLGISFYQITDAFKKIKPVEGRFNIIKHGNVNIIVDFAHTPDGLEKVLETAVELAEGKVVAIFGCGGNRDKLKRPIMGEIASKYADEIILTSDNPRFEEPLTIIDEISKGIVNCCYRIISNRRKAIEFSLNHYKNNETIIIAGKGGERYQEIQGVKYPYNDFEVIKDFLQRESEIKTANIKREELSNLDNQSLEEENDV